jgi:hypothetical protein
MLLPLLLTACAGLRGPEPAAVPAPVPAEPPAVAPPAPEGRGLPVPSSWTSPPCEGRAYERRLQFTDERFAARDLVAPCPPDKLCVWSGILDRGGTWTLDRRQIRLTLDPDPRTGAPPQASQFPLPETLWLADDGTLTEDGGACPYAQAD